MGKSSRRPRLPDAVQEACEAGWHVIPRPRDHRKWVPWLKYQTQQPTMAELRKMFRDVHDSDPDGMWQGIAGAGKTPLVLDFDHKNGKRGNDEMESFHLEPTLRTPSGGHHVYVKSPEYEVRARKPLDPRYPGTELLAGGNTLFTFYGIRDDGEYQVLPDAHFYRVDELTPELRSFFDKANQSPVVDFRQIDVPEDFEDFAPTKELEREAYARLKDGFGRHETCKWLAVRMVDERVVAERRLKVLLRFATKVRHMKERDVFTEHEAYSIWVWSRSLVARPPSKLWMLAFHQNDEGNGKRFSYVHGENVRWCEPLNKWFVWTGRHWEPDRKLVARRLAKDVMNRIYEAASKIPDKEVRDRWLKFASRTGDQYRQAAMLEAAKSEPGIAIVPEEMDTELDLFNVMNGTVDLRTGTLLPHQRGDLITKLSRVTYDPRADDDLWQNFLERVVPDAHIQRFLKRAIGYSLSGSTEEEKLFFLLGPGQNGKSTFVETLRFALGSYATTAPEGWLHAVDRNRDPDAPTPGELKFIGRRLVTAVETREQGLLREETVKQLTSGDERSARPMRREALDYTPTAKIWIATNHRPKIEGTDEAIWRRPCLIPFAEVIPAKERNKNLKNELRTRDAMAAAFNWWLAGHQEWRQHGLKPPKAVRLATEEWRSDEDLLGRFLDECCQLEGVTSKDTLYQAFHEWCEKSGIRHVWTKRTLGTKMKDRDFEDGRVGKSKVHVWKDISLR